MKHPNLFDEMLTAAIGLHGILSQVCVYKRF